MRKRIVGLLTAGVLAGGFVGLAQAAPGPNDSNDHGICTAYFNGQKNSHEQGNGPGPFGTLESGRSLEQIYDFCTGVTSNGNGGGNGNGQGSGGNGIGGNGDQNGRFTGCFDGDQDGDGETCDDTAP